MKQLTIPEQHDIDIGQYGPACEGFIDTIKKLFIKNSDPTKDRVEFIKRSKSMHVGHVESYLEKDLSSTYDNPAWVSKQLENNSGFITIPALSIANNGHKALTTPQDIIKVARAMFDVVKGIAQVEKPFFEHRKHLVSQIKNVTDAAKVDAFWLEHAKELSGTPVERFLKKNKKHFPSFGCADDGKYAWPVNYSNPKETSFTLYGHIKTDGKFEAPTPQNAKIFANTIRELLDIAVKLYEISSTSYVPYWDILSAEYDDLKYGDEIYDYLCSSQSNWEISDLAISASNTVGIIICGLYIAMFDKHMPVPAKSANEGFLDIFKKKEKKEKPERQTYEDYKKEREKLEQKLHDFYKNHQSFKLTGKSFTPGSHLHLSIGGKSPVIHALPGEVGKTFKSAYELSKKFKRDMLSHARIAKPLIDRFEKDMLAVMERDGSVPQEALDKAMLPIIAAKASLEKTYFNSFSKDQHLANDWVGGNPFKMVEYKRDDGTVGWIDESYNVSNPCVSVDKADRVETLIALFKEILPYTENNGLWLNLDGPFDFDAKDIKRIDYEFDRPVRHLSEYMSQDQISAIFTLYSFENNTQAIFYTLCQHIEKVQESVLSYINGSIEKI